MRRIIFIVLVMLISVPLGAFKTPERYNFLFIIVDDLAPVLGSYGHQVVQSPRIDQLSSESVQFNRAYCNIPVCGASRASLLTGKRPQYPDRFITYTSRADEDAPLEMTLPALLKENGYYTVSNGKVFHKIEDSQHAWSEEPFRVLEDLTATQEELSNGKANEKTGRGAFFRVGNEADSIYADGAVVQKSIQDLQRLSQSDKPFFLSIGLLKPHLPFVAPQQYYDLYREIPISGNRYFPESLPEPLKPAREILQYGYTDHYNTEEFHRQARHAYYACVSYVDALIGKLLDELKRLDLEKNTVVVLVGDHGWHLGEHNFWGKHNTLHNAIHAPLLIKAPRKHPVTVNQIVEFVDIYPTICELASIPVPGSLQGVSLLPLMNQENIDWKNEAFSEWQGARTLVTEHYTYTYWFEEKHKGASMLFDRQKDPDENKNVVDSPEYTSVVAAHRERIRSLYKQMNIAD